MEMQATEQIEYWIEQHRSTRDALNVALARLNSVTAELTELRRENGKLKYRLQLKQGVCRDE